ncbi:HAD-IC family P-type ATPase [Shewanella sp. VB17]|uniref:HAD-IC family P-type ATPase n=1 Tax=Shewanella sp. VB17 TaxID=2739432 RepID=UPI0020B8B1BA|nr:HAD-IC family P-type ATPase [Shewanella sp. VB17]
MTLEMLLIRAASLELHSEHPLANAVLEEAKIRGLTLLEAKMFTNVLGRGIHGMIQGTSMAVGNLDLMESLNVLGLDELKAEINQFAEQAKTPVYVAQGGQLSMIVAISDPIKTDAKAGMSALVKLGKRVILLSGDNRKTANAVAKQLGIDEVIAGVLPEQKQTFITALKAEGEIVAMGRC